MFSSLWTTQPHHLLCHHPTVQPCAWLTPPDTATTSGGNARWTPSREHILDGTPLGMGNHWKTHGKPRETRGKPEKKCEKSVNCSSKQRAIVLKLMMIVPNKPMNVEPLKTNRSTTRLGTSHELWLVWKTTWLWQCLNWRPGKWFLCQKYAENRETKRNGNENAINKEATDISFAYAKCFSVCIHLCTKICKHMCIISQLHMHNTHASWSMLQLLLEWLRVTVKVLKQPRRKSLELSCTQLWPVSPMSFRIPEMQPG